MRATLWALALVALAGCATTREETKPKVRVPPPSFAVQHLLDPCWPSDAGAEQRVELTLIRDGARLADVMFEPKEGASNSVGRCLRQVLWLHPWRGDIPERVEIRPPKRPPNGWAVLEHVRLLSADVYGQERGVIDPVPLVQACLARGDGVRPEIRFYVQTQPVHVFALARGTHGDRPTPVVTDTERCVQAVLSSTVYPGSRNYTFDFSRGGAAGEPAPPEAVAHYFTPSGAPAPSGELDPSLARAALAALNPEVGACWEAALARRGGVSGGRTFRIRVTPTGAVAFAQVIPDRSDGGAEAVDYLLDRCVAKAVRAAKIPPPEGGAGELAYSWVFAFRQD